MSKERLEIIKENVYMRSEIAKNSRLGIDTSLKEELELLKEIERLNNIINELEKDINENIKVNDGSIICGLSSNSERKECRVENEAYYNILNKLKELKEDNKNV